MSKSYFRSMVVHDTMEGLRDGISHFSSTSRVALLIAVAPDDPIWVYDPQNLLRGHEPILKEIYIDTDQWRREAPNNLNLRQMGDLHREKNLQLAGLISYGGRSRSVFYQMWFSEHHPDMCSIGPTERWLEHAAWRLSHDLATENGIYTGISGYFLREYATHAVRDYLVDEMNVQLGWDSQIRVYPVLDAVLGISRTLEEGAWARGELVVVEQVALPEVTFLVRFPQNEQPSIESYKHVRKLLQAVENSDRKLISDGQRIVGIARGELPKFCITIDFKGGPGFVKINGDIVCSFSDGHFYSTTRRAKLVEIEEALLEANTGIGDENELFRIVSSIVHNAQEQKFGCTLIIDLNRTPVPVSGQKLMQPLDLRLPEFLKLSQSLAKVDGALHISADLKLHGFACLLDGRAIGVEDRSRGARYNSALRFSAENENILVVVVSVDHPVSIIQQGLELNAQCRWDPVSTCISLPPTLSEWIAGNEPLACQ